MKKQTNTILLIEDDPNDRELIIRTFPQQWRRRYDSFPATILTDIKMPRLSGFEVLQHLKSDPEWAVIPTIVLSASADPDDIKTAYRLGAASYFVKPQEYAALRYCDL